MIQFIRGAKRLDRLKQVPKRNSRGSTSGLCAYHAFDRAPFQSLVHIGERFVTAGRELWLQVQNRVPASVHLAWLTGVLFLVGYEQKTIRHFQLTDLVQPKAFGGNTYALPHIESADS